MKSYINFPFIKFKKSRLHNWAKRKYITSENRKQDKTENAFLRYSTLISADKMESAEQLNKYYEFDPLANYLSALIKEFTFGELNEENFLVMIQVLESAGIKIQIMSDIMFIESNDFDFCVKKLSKFEPDILKHLKDIEQQTRTGKCHPYGVVATLFFDGLDEYETKFVTGRIYQLSPRAKYLHSWVEIKYDGNVFVVDPTKNSVYLKEMFYEINHVGETTVLSADEVKRDYDLIKKLTDYDDYAVKVYYENPERGRMLYEKLVEIGEIEGNKSNEK